MKILKTYIIYLATNVKNGKVYVGQTWETLNERISNHLSQSLSGNKKCYFNLAIVKHGPRSFIWREIDRVFTEKAANALEIHYIKYYKSQDRKFGYNLARGGRVNRGFKKTEEQKKRQSEILKQKHNTGEIKPWNKDKKYPELSGENSPSFGLKRTPEQKEKMSQASKAARASGEVGGNHSKLMKAKYASGEIVSYWLGKNRSEEEKQKMSEAHKGKNIGPTKRARKVLCIETGDIYDSSHIAAKKLNLHSTNICKTCNGIYKVCGGFHWKFLDEIN